MAGSQSARGDVGEGVAEFMARRRREVARLEGAAEAVGRAGWAGATRLGLNLVAPRPSDVLALGARILDARNPAPRLSTSAAGSAPRRDSGQSAVPLGVKTQAASAPTSVKPTPPTASYGALQGYVGSPDDLAELRRQQAEFAVVEGVIGRKNAWMAVPALAPAAVVLGLEGAAAIAARLAGTPVKQTPFQFTERDPYLRVGDNSATRAGRRAHKQLEDRLVPKNGWDYEPSKQVNGRLMKPDVGTPPRNPADTDKRYYLELKPNTPSGRRAAARAVRRYQEGLGQKVRAIYYDPKDFL